MKGYNTEIDWKIKRIGYTVKISGWCTISFPSVVY